MTKANAPYQHYTSMNRPTKENYDTATTDCTTMNTAATNARN